MGAFDVTRISPAGWGRGRHYGVCAVSGSVWVAIACVLSSGVYGPSVWGGVLASPFIGMAMGKWLRPTRRWPFGARLLASLGALYGSAAMFGLSTGLYRALGTRYPNMLAYAPPVEDLLGTLWGLTVYVVVLWPLAHFNLWLVARMDANSRVDQIAENQYG